MKKIKREKYLASGWEKHWKEEGKKRISEMKNKARMTRARIKWKRQSIGWGHEHPKRGVSK